ncbi:SUF system Fe-S cluster assembly protein [Paenibacillus vulneris]|uniref:Metal-sulfur cluster assembly factor n=1 Tax=Paenibacillus vulneris TaxID=1133364 RepID=A0ABW3URK4_9BACL|nr:MULTISPECIES: metal-sulfur cluster assembly factor [unclassified Paenibacillus]MBE1440771.1 metal-sulfur cluster biosynthetic enzyme [Paenibacillus sp. OAS669]
MKTEDRILTALEEVLDPEVGVNIVDLGLVYDVTVNASGTATIKMTLTIPECPLADQIVSDVKAAVEQVEGVNKADVQLVWEPKWTPSKMNDLAKEQIRARQTLV